MMPVKIKKWLHYLIVTINEETYYLNKTLDDFQPYYNKMEEDLLMSLYDVAFYDVKPEDLNQKEKLALDRLIKKKNFQYQLKDIVEK